jgi:DNA repair exonuclease SbcCD ATPase subunit
MTPCPPANLSSPSTLLLPGFTTPPQIGPIAPPTPTDSAQHHISAYDRSNTPVVRLTKDVWESMGNELSTLSKEKRDLEQRLASAERNQQALRDEDHDIGAQIGKLRYQNEANREQKATMGRALAEKDVEIKTQQLEIDRHGKKIIDLETEIHRLGKMVGDAERLRTTINDNEAAHARDLETKTTAIERLEERLEDLTHELDSAKQAQMYEENHAASTQKLSDQLSKKEKNITDLRFELLQEKERADFLEDEVERFREQVNQGSMDKLKAELREKSSQCDRNRTQLKAVEQQLHVSQDRLKRFHNSGEGLRGGAHLVVPNEKSKLPKQIISCAECYAKNLPCDNGARCQSCALKNIQCARWRCSMKHRLGECPDHPCALPHDPQGWLVTLDARPEW